MIIAEAVGVNQEGLGWLYTPGIHNDTQVEKWSEVTKAFHVKRERIASQSWYMDRTAYFNDSGRLSKSTSAVNFTYQIHTYDGKTDPEVTH